jgi:hypothetical protein
MSVCSVNQPSLTIDSNPCEPASSGVRVCGLGPELMASIGSYIQAGGLLQLILRVAVVPLEASNAGGLPDIFGRHQLLEDGIRFVPHFPFARGVSYRARFDPRPLGRSGFSGALALAFSLTGEQDTSPPEVEQVFPSSAELPANLLRFYIRFSKPMQRGCVETEISILGPDAEPAPDVLYRAPVELWDRSMQCLTILLDPGRLKRGVGPNRELGPPLELGQEYTLAIGAGIVDSSGRRLRRSFRKRFRVTEAVREPIDVEQWQILPPQTETRDPLLLVFPGPLDWALLSQMISIRSAHGQALEGRIVVDRHEGRWSFTPTLPWAPGHYHVRVASGLEDVCGNSVIAAFDRPLRSVSDPDYDVSDRSVFFELLRSS